MKSWSLKTKRNQTLSIPKKSIRWSSIDGAHCLLLSWLPYCLCIETYLFIFWKHSKYVRCSMDLSWNNILGFDRRSSTIQHHLYTHRIYYTVQSLILIFQIEIWSAKMVREKYQISFQTHQWSALRTLNNTNMNPQMEKLECHWK